MLPCSKLSLNITADPAGSATYEGKTKNSVDQNIAR
jgi:hypothetical protein